MLKNVYIHIPFCKYICSYCDFCKKYIKNQPVDAYLEALETEITHKLEKRIVIDSLYLGGGTPSSLNLAQLQKLRRIINKHFTFSENYEFTFECNPDDVNEEMVNELKLMGVNRISMGVQILNDERLKELRRGHSVDDVKQALDCLCNVIDNVSCDFIFNLPKQTKADIDLSLDFIKQYKLKHVSYYGLILEENTILDTQEYDLLNEDDEADMYYYIQEKLNELGLKQYEISNYAFSGYESQHNMAYWLDKEYYGFGLGASAYIDGVRLTNTKSMQDYLNQENLIIEEHKLDKADKDYEKVFLNLRMNRGLDNEFINEHNLTINPKYFASDETYTHIRPEYFYESSELIVELLEQLDEGE